MSEKQRIVGFLGVVKTFGGKVPSTEELEKYEIVEDGKKERIVPDLDRATVFKRGELMLLFSEETSEEFKKVLDEGRARVPAEFVVAKAMEIYGKIAEGQRADEAYQQKYAKLCTASFGDRDSVWTAMENMVQLAPTQFKPVVGEISMDRLKKCEAAATAFEKAYLEAFKKNGFPEDAKAFFEWERRFIDQYNAAGGSAPYIKGLSLVTRSFGGQHGTFGCFVLQDDVELFKSCHATREVYGGEKVAINYHIADAYRGLLRWEVYLLPTERQRQDEHRRENDEREEKLRKNLAGFVTDDTLGFLRKNGNDDRRGLKKLRRGWKEGRSNQRQTEE